MHNCPTIFFDIGGVLLTKAWDTAARKRAAAVASLVIGYLVSVWPP